MRFDEGIGSRISTKLDIKERQEIWEDLKKQYPVHPTDVYATCISDGGKFNTKGELVEYQNIDLGHESKFNRLEKIRHTIHDENKDFDDYIESLNREHEEDTKLKAKLILETQSIDKKLKEMQKQKNFKKNIVTDKSLQIKYNSLSTDLDDRQKKLETLSIKLANFQSKITKIREEHETRINVLENILARDEVSGALLAERLQKLKNWRDELKTRLADARANAKNQMIVVSDAELSDFEKIQNDSRELIKNFDERKVNTLRIRSLEIEIRRIDSDIKKIEAEISSVGNIKERYYVTREFTQDGKMGDLVVFSRRLKAEHGNIESEMTNSNRFVVDVKEATKTMNRLIYLLMIGNAFFTASIFAGVIPNLLTWHSFYIFIIIAMMLWNSIKEQRIDRIFEAFYYFFDTSYVDVPYVDSTGTERTFRAKCYHLELFYSDKTNISGIFKTTEADIIEASEDRLISMVSRYQTLLTSANIEATNYREQVQLLTSKNQDLVGSYKEIEVNIKAAIKREYDYKRENKPGFLQSQGGEIVKYFGWSVIIYMILSMLSEIMPDFVRVGSGTGSPTSSFTLGLFVGVFLGALSILALLRFSRSR